MTNITTMSKESINLDSINQSSYFINNARAALTRDVVESQVLTLSSITACATLAYSLYINNAVNSDFNILNPATGEVSENKLRKLIIDSVFAIKQAEYLQSAAGRVIYNKVRAGIIVFNHCRPALAKAWQAAKKAENPEQAFIDSTTLIVAELGSMTRILKLAKPAAKTDTTKTDTAKTDGESAVMDDGVVVTKDGANITPTAQLIDFLAENFGNILTRLERDKNLINDEVVKLLSQKFNAISTLVYPQGLAQKSGKVAK